MLRRVLYDFLWTSVLLVAIKLCARLVFGLSSNAVMGWGDDQIAAAFDIKAPALRAVIAFLTEWAIPLGAAFFLVAAYHWWDGRRRSAKKSAEDPLAKPTIRYQFQELNSGELRVWLVNTSDIEVQDCELRLMRMVDAETGQGTACGIALRELGHETTIFRIPAMGTAISTVFWLGKPGRGEVYGNVLLGHRFLKAGASTYRVLEMIKGDLYFTAQARNMPPLNFVYSFDRNSRKLFPNESARSTEEKDVSAAPTR